MANNEKIKAGQVPVIQTFGDTWTSQLFVPWRTISTSRLPYRPSRPTTPPTRRHASTLAAMAGFQHQADVFQGRLSQRRLRRRQV